MKCKDCVHFDGDSGRCLRNAPPAMVVPMEMVTARGLPDVVVIWPQVDREGRCGEWKG